MDSNDSVLLGEQTQYDRLHSQQVCLCGTSIATQVPGLTRLRKTVASPSLLTSWLPKASLWLRLGAAALSDLPILWHNLAGCAPRSVVEGPEAHGWYNASLTFLGVGNSSAEYSGIQRLPMLN